MASKEILRDDLLILLASMGIDLSVSKLSPDELNKKVGLALDASQQLSRHLPTMPFDPSTLSPWDLKKEGDKDAKTLLKATQRKNVSEICEGVMERPKQGGRAKKQDTFKEMRQSIMAIAFACDQGMRELVYVDENGKGIFVKVSLFVGNGYGVDDICALCRSSTFAKSIQRFPCSFLNTKNFF